MPTLQALLREAREALQRAGTASGHPDAELLLRHALGQERAFLYAHPEFEPSATEAERFRHLVAARAQGAPVQYLTGVQEFHGRAFAVTPAVLIPRPETELVVAAALERLPAGAAPRVADVGTGSGCIAVTLALERPAAQLIGVDRSRPALEVARGNAAHWGGRVAWVEADLLSAMAAGALDLVVANPPYVAADELPSLAVEVREHEPREALVAGPSGLEVYQRLVPQAWRALRPGGWLILEIGYRAGAAVRGLLAAWAEIEVRRDWQDWERVVVARRA